MSDFAEYTPEKEDTQPVRPVQDEPSRTQRPRQSGGCGCWLPALLTLFLAAVLVLVGLFLPPVNLYDRLFGIQYTMLSAESNAVRSPDAAFTVVIDPANPGTDFGVALNEVPLNDFTSGNSAAGEWVPAALASLPPSLALQSAVYQVQTTGTEPGTVTFTVNVPPTAGDADILDLYGWDAASGQWRFMPSQASVPGARVATVTNIPDTLALFQAAPSGQSTVVVALDAAHVLSNEAAQVATIVAPGGLQPMLDGRLTGSLAAGIDPGQGYWIMPVLRNYADPRALDPDTVAAILNNSTVRNEHANQVATFVVSNNFNGVMIDYRDLPTDLRPNFSAFVRELATLLHSQQKLLGVVVPSAENVAGAWETGAYDWQALGAAVDYLQIDLTLDPASYAPGVDRPVEAMLRWAVGEVSRYKLLLGLSALSVRESNGTFTSIGYDEALSALGDVTISAETSDAGTVNPGTAITASLDGFSAVSGQDTLVETPFVDYMNTDGSQAARMWLTTADALRFRMNRTLPFGLGGVAFEDLLAQGVVGDVYQSILNYKLQLPAAPTPVELALRWRIEGVNGVIGEVNTSLGEDLAVTIEAPDGNYAVNVVVVGGNGESPRSGAAVALFAPTATPTPLPTATPTPIPTATPTLAPVVPTVAAISSAPVSAPGAGSIAAGSFEYGGHVTNTASDRATNAMRGAGMNWMKIQIRYTAGMSPDVVSADIQNAHSRGFKVLLAIPGVPGELAVGGQGYIGQYTSFLGGVAGYGPDAIEVWNEPNLDREWPTGQISGAAFADLLRQSYQAIKGANGGVMVISGAPAPTGAEGAYPGQVVNDDRFVRDMVNAGALQYVDCVGAHYNEGIISPLQTSGDPRDNYYTRYFQTQLDTYWNIIGGQKPICFTELGFLSPEGFPPLPDFFAWAQSVSVAQQAAWLAEAAALSSQSGKVRLMIVWNVDFTQYGADPQAGYAMIRPDGTCPACNALANAR